MTLLHKSVIRVKIGNDCSLHVSSNNTQLQKLENFQNNSLHFYEGEYSSDLGSSLEEITKEGNDLAN